MADWSLLPKDLLQLISDRLETCFERVQFRSVCSSWWSAVPSSRDKHGLGVQNLLSNFYVFDSNEYCTVKKSPIFLFRFETNYLIVGISNMDNGKQMLMSPLKSYNDHTSKCNLFLNTLNAQIIHLGHSYKLYATGGKYHSRTRSPTACGKVANLPLDNEDFAVMVGLRDDVTMYRSKDKKWKAIDALYLKYGDMVSFKGKFYVVNTWGGGRGRCFVIEPSLKVTKIQAIKKSYGDQSYFERLVVSKENLLLVQQLKSRVDGEGHRPIFFKVFMLEEKCKRWVWVNDLEDQIVFLGPDWYLCYSAKELPGTKGNCIVFEEECIVGVTKIFVFDLGTWTSYECNESSGYMGVFGKNKESLLSCGILTIPN